MTRKTPRLGKPAAPRKGIATKSRGVRNRGQQKGLSPDDSKAIARVQDGAGSEAMIEQSRQGLPESGTNADRENATIPPLVQVELDSAASSGFINGRFDIQLRGRVAATATVEALEFIVGDVVTGRIDFGDASRAPGVILADGTPAREHNFMFTLQREQSQAAGGRALRVRVIGADDPLHEQEFLLAIDPAGSEPVKIIGGPCRPLLNLFAARPPIILYVERVTLNDQGGFLLHGWAVAMNPLVTVQAFLGEQRLPAAQLGVTRNDVAAHYTGYPNARTSGFTLIAQADPSYAREVREARVQAISRGGFSHQVIVPLERLTTRRPLPPTAPPRPDTDSAPPRVTASGTPLLEAEVRTGRRLQRHAAAATEQPSPDKPDRRILHFCDEALFQPDGTLRVVGWAVCDAGLREIAIELDGVRVGTAELGLARPDVTKEFTGIASAGLAGFRFEQNFSDLAEGSHGLRVVLRNKLGDEVSEARQLHAVNPVASSLNQPVTRPDDQPEFRFELDSPQVVAGSVVEPVTSRLTIEGWVLARSGVETIAIHLDGEPLGEAQYGLARQDVGAAFPDWEDALRSGYAFHCPPRALRHGEHTVKLEVRARNGQLLQRNFKIDVKKSDEDGHIGTIRRRIGHVEAAMQAELLDSLGYRPKFHLLLRQRSNDSPDGLRGTLESLVCQSYPAWLVTVLAENADAALAARSWLAEHKTPFAERIAVVDGTQAGFDAPLITDAEGATLFGVLCPGDLLGCDALGEIALAGGLHRQPEFLYADEARPSPTTNQSEAFLKPDFSPDLLLSTNYIGRPWFATGSLLRQCKFTARALFTAGEFDLVLRCTELAQRIHHVPKLLAQRTAGAIDDDEASRLALLRAAQRRGFAAEVEPGCLPGIFRLRRTQPARGKVSIIIPTCAAHGHIKTCIRTLREKTAYQRFEIVCIDNIPATGLRWKAWLQENADRVVDIPDEFNWSRFNNIAAAACDGEYLLFLNDDIEITRPDWLDALLEHAQRPEVGVVGPQLLYPGGKVQHAGMFLGAGGIGRHAFRFAAQDDPGYFGLALTQRNVIAVTGACMLMRRSLFEAMGGFEEGHSVINNDLDFCLRVHQSGKLTIYTPYASLLHHELASRDRIGDTFDTTQFDARWRTTFAGGDPYFNHRLSRQTDDYRPDDEAVQTVFAGHPLFDRLEIHRILVVKLDHIGDVITSLPAIRRLKELFPHASVTLLAGRAARSVVSLEPSIDNFIEFDFFHVRSQLGEKHLTKEDYESLGEQLIPHRFDLAIDLRKQLSTREVLRHCGARFLAGYDQAGQFPYLDIALEWDADRMLLRKRSHVVDDLLILVEAVGTACTTTRDLLSALPEPISLHVLPESVQALFELPVVAVHAGVGTVTRQWPEDHFSALVDLLVERNLVNVVLVGGPDDRELSERIAQRSRHPDRVASLVGMLPLADLPRLLARCRLFIGNNSGPQHIAAAAGIPTIGIHSGVVDATEWGPLGRRAVALRRNMVCSPCYLARPEDCPRGFSCLRHLEPTAVHEAAQTLLARPLPQPSTSQTLREERKVRPISSSEKLRTRSGAAQVFKPSHVKAVPSKGKPAKRMRQTGRSKPRRKSSRQSTKA